MHRGQKGAPGPLALVSRPVGAENQTQIFGKNIKGCYLPSHPSALIISSHIPSFVELFVLDAGV